MLFIIAAILLAGWILLFVLKVTSGLIHLALAAAIILFLIGFIRGGRRGVAAR